VKKKVINQSLSKVLYAIKCLGGLGTTKDIRNKCFELGYEIPLRQCLRMLERNKIVKRDQTEDETIMYRWEFLNFKAIDNYLEGKIANS